MNKMTVMQVLYLDYKYFETSPTVKVIVMKKNNMKIVMYVHYPDYKTETELTRIVMIVIMKVIQEDKLSIQQHNNGVKIYH